ncbi:MAG: UDP-N-acetylglucosamine 2-epimerase (non-hydrolyzing) [Thermodesulfobacteriota bacterium]|nr:UDP-N-acetylglucosamine 2-epimerase (non-hydrolyzing) [Thermodesulfobacteriota bacterium]
MKTHVKWILVAAARPNFMKIAPLIRAIHAYNEMNSRNIHPFLVHTGQHYDVNMSDSFFKDLNLPEPDVHLGVGSGNHGEQTGKVLIEFEKVLLQEKPDLVIVVGDVNSTVACSLAAVKLHIPVAHIEAGLRSFDRKMPEEINRLLTDAISDYLFTPSPDGDENLVKEGIPPEKVFLVGDIMVDSLLFNLEQAKKTDILEHLGLRPKSSTDQGPLTIDYCLLTLHRPSNVDNKESLSRILGALATISSSIPILFPAHPRTRKMINEFNLQRYFVDLIDNELPIINNGIFLANPFGYLDFLNLMAHAKIVLTDSGGIQEETTVLNIPCITLRDTTERPITLSEGTNVLVNDDPQKIVEEVGKILAGQRRKGICPTIWDGHTAERIVKILAAARTV